MRNARWILGAVLTVLAAFASIAVTQPGVAKAGDQSAAAEVKIDNFSFGPASLIVAAGTTVTFRGWLNQGATPPYAGGYFLGPVSNGAGLSGSVKMTAPF